MAPKAERPKDSFASAIENFDATNLPKEAPVTLDEYFSDLPDIRAFLEEYQRNVFHELDNLLPSAEGTPLEEPMRQTVSRFKHDFDRMLLRLCTLIDLKKNRAALTHILSHPQPPSFKTVRLIGDAQGRTDLYGNKPTMVYLSSKSTYNHDPEILYANLVHEFIHAFLENVDVDNDRSIDENEQKYHSRHKILYEGITETLTREITDQKNRAIYDEPVTLASALMLLNPELLITWYASGNHEQFQDQLVETFQKKGASAREAQDITDRIFSVQDRINRFFGELHDKLDVYAKQAGYPQLTEYLFWFPLNLTFLKDWSFGDHETYSSVIHKIVQDTFQAIQIEIDVKQIYEEFETSVKQYVRKLAFDIRRYCRSI